MGLLSKLKSLLGADDDRDSRSSGVDVTVEREPSAESERAVKESADGDEDAADEVEAGDDDGTATDDETDDPVAAESDAAASTESLVEDEHADDPTRAAEPAEAAATGDEDDAEAEPESEPDPAAGSTDPVSSVKGIGPAYAERLTDAGVETVGDLATADPEELAEQTDLSAKRIGRWVESAQNRD